jgi:RNA polymerase primary sigma factor
MALPDDVRELLRRDLPKKPIGELLHDLQRDLPQALEDFLSSENSDRQKWIDSKLVIETSDTDEDGSEEFESYSEESQGLPELHWLAKILKHKPASSEDHENWAKQIEAGLFAQEQIEKITSLDDKKYKRDLEQLVSNGKSCNELFLLHNLRLVWSIARKSPQTLSTEEHFQNGIFGLIRAIEGWDWRQGFQFSTYASWWIRQSIYRAMSDTAYTIRIPVHMLEKISIESRAKNDSDYDNSFSKDYEDADEDEEVTASGKNRFTDSLVLAKNAINRSFSYEMIVEKYDFLLEYQVDAFEDTTFDFALHCIFIYQLNLVLGTLTEREEIVIRNRYGLMDGEAKTLDEIGIIFGLTRERIRQIESKTMAKLRHPSRTEALKDYLGATLSSE